MRQLLSIFFLLSVFHLQVSGQNWEYFMQKEKDILPVLTMETTRGDFAIGIWEGIINNYDTIYDFHMLFLSENGVLLDSFELTHHFSNYLFRGYHISNYEDQILILGRARDSNKTNYPSIIILDTNNQISWDTIYKDEKGKYFDFIQPESDSTFVVSGYAHHRYWQFLTLWKMDSKFRIKSVYTDSTVLGWNRCKKGYNFTADRFYCQEDMILHTYDTKLVKSDSFNFGRQIPWLSVFAKSNIEILDDSLILVPGVWSDPLHPGDNDNIFLAKFDYQLNLIDTFLYNKPIYHESTPFAKTVCEKNDYYYLAFTENLSMGDFVFDVMDTTVFCLLKLDKNLNPIWERHFRNDVSYAMYNMIPTSDNGFLMSGVRWDWKKDPNRYVADLYVLKVDSNGNYVGVNELEKQHVSFNFYPNPSNGVLNVSFETNHTSVQLDLIEIQGSIVHSWTFSNTSSEIIDLSTYANGIYLLRATTDNSIETVRVVKSQ